jgi:hypothetical protein
MGRTLSQHVEDNQKELDTANISTQRRRHLEDELKNLENYHNNHPNEDHDPNALELFCDSNPNSPECKIFDN